MEQFTNFVVPGFRHSTAVYYRDDTLVIPGYENGNFYILSNNKNEAQTLRDEVTETLSTAPDPYGTLGVKDIETHSGREYTLNMIRDIPEVTNISCENGNRFEKKFLMN